MAQDKLNELYPSAVDHRELLRVLHQHFGLAQISGRDVITFPATTKYQLRVRVEDGRIRSALTGPGFDPNDFRKLQGKVRNSLIESRGDTIARVVLFSFLPVTGWLAAPEVGLQICPPPDAAPRPTEIHADNPFVLEFRMRRGGDNRTTNQRCVRLAMEWGLVLNGLLRTSVRVTSPRSTSHWGYDPDDETSKWFRDLYFVPGFQPYADDFTPIAGPILPLVPHDEYYKSDVRPGAERDELMLPDSLPGLLHTFSRFSASRRRQFLRAATWIQTSSRVWDINTSSWFIGLVSAIETFVEPDRSDICDNCGSVLGVTRAFKELVERYSPDSDKRMRDTIYRYRSKLSHGEMLLQIDEAPWAFGTSFSVDEREAEDRLARIVRDVMVNWLHKFAAIEQLASQLGEFAQQPMQIAILGWGSLLSDPGDMTLDGEWELGGPELPIEFSRVSRNRRLTLVIDHDDGEEVTTYFVKSGQVELSEAREELRIREGTPNIDNIGYVDLVSGDLNARSQDDASRIRQWARDRGVDAVIWTDLASNFRDEIGEEFTVERAIDYLLGLDSEARKRAFDYIDSAPAESETPLRRALRAAGLTGASGGQP